MADKTRRPLGAHMSVAGGVVKAVERACQVESDALQIFSKSQLRWTAKPLAAAEAAAFREAVAASGLRFVCAHVGYLINLASSSDAVRQQSVEALVDEIERAALLGCATVVMHPGSPKEDSAELGLQRLVAGLVTVLDRTAKLPVRIALENTAGQGATLGATLGELAEIVDRLDRHPRLALCFDTCHGFAAGIDLRQPADVRRLADQIGSLLGLDRLLAFHLNDCKQPFASHRDRHEQIGQGTIGQAGFANLLNEPSFKGIPGILETDKDEKTLAEDIVNLQLLRQLEVP